MSSGVQGVGDGGCPAVQARVVRVDGGGLGGNGPGGAVCRLPRPVAVCHYGLVKERSDRPGAQVVGVMVHWSASRIHTVRHAWRAA